MRFNALRGRVDKAEASTRSEVERTLAQLVDSYHELGARTRSEVERTLAQLVDSYRELGARTADFEVPDREVGLRFLEWLQEELLALPTIVEGFMSFASLVTCEGAMNALSHEGCSHYEGFDRSDEDFGREIFKVKDPVVKDSAGALFDRRLSGRSRSSWTRTASWVHGLLTSKCPTGKWAFASSNGYRRSCWHSRPSWRASCPLPPSSPAKGP